MFVKVCGITRLEDARAAVDAGAQAIGFVFWAGSPRFIDPYRARHIAAALPAFVTPVGVFVDQPLDYVSGVASLVNLGAVQLHGAETPQFASALRRPVIKALTPGDDDGAWAKEITILLDVHDPSKHGGTGRTIDWAAAAPVAARRRTLLAGGLTPENVGEAIARVRPFGIDVSSGVERAPGVKDHARLLALFEAVHAVNHVPTRS
jgi:phosphoribosylanthranilate isomerase